MAQNVELNLEELTTLQFGLEDRMQTLYERRYGQNGNPTPDEESLYRIGREEAYARNVLARIEEYRTAERAALKARIDAEGVTKLAP